MSKIIYNNFHTYNVGALIQILQNYYNGSTRLVKHLRFVIIENKKNEKDILYDDREEPLLNETAPY